MDKGQRESGFENVARRENDYKLFTFQERKKTSITLLLTFVKAFK